MAEAMRRCPHAIVVRIAWSATPKRREHFFEILGDYSPDVEGLSLDEAFLDVTGSERLLGDGETIAHGDQAARARGARRSSPRSASRRSSSPRRSRPISTSPTACASSRPRACLPFLHALPMTRLWGVGEATREILASMGLSTIGDVARYPEAALVVAARRGHRPSPRGARARRRSRGP